MDWRVRAIVLRDGTEIACPLELALSFLDGYRRDEGAHHGSGLDAFDETDLRLANRDGARIAAVQAAAILERRSRIEEALRAIAAGASLVGPPRSVPWAELRALFEAFAGISGVGFSKATKALHRKRPALIPILDSVVQAYLGGEGPEAGSFGERAVGLVHSFKRDLDRNRPALHELRRELRRHGCDVTEVRLLDIVVWSAGTRGAGAVSRRAKPP